ncbi:DNA polymerase III subunit gamma/tau [Candidatus Nomurabacteria bacterium]|nr:DNA polymerase III subunit gamma/tau [Candidatus Nomurabacteria bacterium]
MGKALYRKYRSRSLDEIVGQDHVTTLLKSALKSGRIAHAYLFTGPRGVGKTSIARIVAHEINKLPYDGEESHLDIIEIDAASNNGVDDIRNLRDKAHIAPASAAKKVYIIDEVHMLSKPAFNALLKTLEEPPEHVVFILATTDADKLPDTIVSRTQRYSFRRASRPNIVSNLKRIAASEKIDIDDDALELIAQHSDGSYRDSVSLLDQLSGYSDEGPVTASSVENILGLASGERVSELAQAALEYNFSTVVELLQSLEDDGVQPRVVASQLSHELRKKILDDSSALVLLDRLSLVGQSHTPYAKLLSVVGLFAAGDPEKRRSVKGTGKATATKAAASTKAPTVESEKIPSDKPKQKIKNKTNQPPASESNQKKAPANKNNSTFDWSNFCGGIQSGVGLSSILKKSNGTLDGNTLTIFAGRKFYKTKLDTAKSKQAISSRLEEMGYHNIEIDILPGALPHPDSQIAQVAAMMGGGEEVEYKE